MRRTSVSFIVIFVACAALASAPKAFAGKVDHTWSTLRVRKAITSMNGGKKAGFGAWRRQDSDGQERWISNGNGNHERWEVRPDIVFYGTRIEPGDRAQANRFTIMMILLTNRLMTMEKYTNKNNGSMLDHLATAAAAHPGHDISVDEGPFLVTLTKVAGVNAWVYSMQLR